MKSSRIRIGSFAAALSLIAALALPAITFSATLTARAPETVTHVPTFGATVGDLGAVEVQDQSGTQDTPANYVQLQTPGSKVYKADFSFTLPGSVRRYTAQN